MRLPQPRDTVDFLEVRDSLAANQKITLFRYFAKLNGSRVVNLTEHLQTQFSTPTIAWRPTHPCQTCIRPLRSAPLWPPRSRSCYSPHSTSIREYSSTSWD